MNNDARPAHNAEAVEGPAAAAVEPIDVNAVQELQVSNRKIRYKKRKDLYGEPFYTATAVLKTYRNTLSKKTEWCNSPCWGVERDAFDDGNAVDWNLQKLRNHPYFCQLKSNLETRLLIPRSSMEPYEPPSMRRQWDNWQDKPIVIGRKKKIPVSKSRANRTNLQDDAVDQAPARPAAEFAFDLYAFLWQGPH